MSSSHAAAACCWFLMQPAIRKTVESRLQNAQVGESAADPVTPKLQFGPEDGVLETNVALSSSYLAVRRCHKLTRQSGHQQIPSQHNVYAARAFGCRMLMLVWTWGKIDSGVDYQLCRSSWSGRLPANSTGV